MQHTQKVIKKQKEDFVKKFNTQDFDFSESSDDIKKHIGDYTTDLIHSIIEGIEEGRDDLYVCKKKCKHHLCDLASQAKHSLDKEIQKLRNLI